MKKLPSFVLSRLAERQSKSSEHPDASLLTACVQGNASRAERDAVLSHAADCPDCREVLSKIGTDDSMAAKSSKVTGGGMIGWGWKVAATAATMLLIGIAVWQFSANPHSPSIAKPSLPQVPVSAPTEPAPAPSVLIVPQQSKARKTVIRHNQLGAPKGVPEIAPSAPPSQLPAPTVDLFSPKVMRTDLVARLPSLSSYRNGVMIWTLAESANGVVRKSDDGGKTWHTVPVDGITRFYALSANGQDVWVGGADGRLFHSVDGGMHWSLVAVTNADTPLQENIVGIDARANSINVKTASGLTVQSRDGGEHWEQSQ